MPTYSTLKSIKDEVSQSVSIIIMNNKYYIKEDRYERTKNEKEYLLESYAYRINDYENVCDANYEDYIKESMKKYEEILLIYDLIKAKE